MDVYPVWSSAKSLFTQLLRSDSFPRFSPSYLLRGKCSNVLGKFTCVLIGSGGWVAGVWWEYLLAHSAQNPDALRAFIGVRVTARHSHSWFNACALIPVCSEVLLVRHTLFVKHTFLRMEYFHYFQCVRGFGVYRSGGACTASERLRLPHSP